MGAPEFFIPEQGIVHDLPNNVYHAQAALSKSQLADFMVCPANYYGLHRDPDRPPREEKPSQRAGTLLHTLVLEPDTFKDRYAVGPNVSSRATKEWKTWEAGLPAGVTALKSDELAEGQKQAASLRTQAEVAELLSSGHAETSIFWICPRTGLRLRCRPDWLHETPDGWIVLDLKTGPADPWAFSSQIARMTYHIQDAMYSEGIAIATGKPVLAFVFGVVDTSAPFLSMCATIDDTGRESAARTFHKSLDDFARCLEKDEWPGYEGVQLLSLPQYALE